MRQKVKTTGSIALLLAAPLLFAGCASDDGGNSKSDSNSQGLSDSDLKKLQDISDENGGPAQLGNLGKNNNNNNNNDDDVDVEVAESGSLPNGWPSEAVVPKGDITYSGKVDDAFSLLMIAENDDIDDAIDRMKSNGFSETLNMGTNEGRIASFENSDWTVSIITGVDEASGKMSVIYTVSPL